MPELPVLAPQITLQKNLADRVGAGRSLREWLEAYFALEVTTADSSRKVQRRDLELFVGFFAQENRNDRVDLWTPRLSRSFVDHLRSTVQPTGERQWNDRTLNRVIAHLKTLAKWIHTHRPFQLGNPMAKVRSIATASLLRIERALSEAERRRLLDAADLLLQVGGRSRDRHRFKEVAERPLRQNYRPYRNRAIIYCLLETGMRRAAVCSITLNCFDPKARSIRTLEKGAVEHVYQISREGARAIADYIEHERAGDAAHFSAGTLFLPAAGTQNHSGRLHPNAINEIWNEACELAGVKGKTPHSARHAMGRHLAQKFGNVEAVQRQLGHKNAAYSLQYSRVTDAELSSALDERG